MKRYLVRTLLYDDDPNPKPLYLCDDRVQASRYAAGMASLVFNPQGIIVDILDQQAGHAIVTIRPHQYQESPR